MLACPHLHSLKAGSEPQQPDSVRRDAISIPFNLHLPLPFVRKVLEQLSVASLKNSYIFHFAATMRTKKELDERLK